ncbi:MAG TPA: hypothetical protein VEL07_01830 [Planctomycetota bacterium]|nr:hypothetical protein [Planctomycetota bacterium]
MTDLDVPDVEAFVRACGERGLERVIVAWQREYSQRPGDGPVHYDRVQRSVLLAYAGGTIIRCTLDGEAAERGALATRLRAAGLLVEERCRNLGASEHAG